MQGAIFAFHKTFDMIAASNAAAILVLDIGLIIICIMFYHRVSSSYDTKKTSNVSHTIGREDKFDSNKLSIVTMEWWSTAHNLDDDEADNRKTA
jgi:hypothetical protein